MKKPYIVYVKPEDAAHGQCMSYECDAENEGDAVEQARNAFPNCSILDVFETFIPY